jgi:aspartyl-tRNA(Asn)/glutamyl-tRNA(Gln) amidotransferase subunit A
MSFGDAAIDAGVALLAQAYAAGLLDPVDVTRRYLSRIDRFDHAIGAYADLDRTRALDSAAASQIRWLARRPLSALDGVPIAIKSNIAIEGLPWTAGIGAYGDRVAASDAAVVARLRAGGAVILGTTRMDEAALGAAGDNPWFGRTHNPYHPDHVAGGSSGGAAAAVAAGFCAAALGTDTFGSVRIPAAWCGVFGFKPEFDTVPTTGIVPLASGLDTVGFLARAAADCRILKDWFTPDASGPVDLSAGDIRLSGFAGDQAILGDAVRESLEENGLQASIIDLPEDGFSRQMKAALLLAEAEGATTYGALLDDETARISPRLRAMLLWGRKQTAPSIQRAQDEIAAYRKGMLADWLPRTLLVTPTTTGPAPPRDAADDRWAARFTLAASIARLPAIAVPVGQNGAGMPLSIQIAGPSETLVFALAEILGRMPPPPGLV